MIEAIGLVLAIVGLLFAFETPRRRFLDLFARQQGRNYAPTTVAARKERASLEIPGDLSELSQALRASYSGHLTPAIRRAEALGPVAAPLVPQLVKHLRSPSGPVRLAASKALVAIGTPEATRAVAAFERK